MDPLLTKQEILEQGGVTKAQWRLQRKRFSVRVEFEQAGSLGMEGAQKLLYSGTSEISQGVGEKAHCPITLLALSKRKAF